MIYFIEEAFQVYVYNVVIAFMNVLLRLLYRLMGVFVWTKTMAVFSEL